MIIGFAKIKYMPYMNFYLEQIDRNKNDVHMLYWNRDGQDEPVPENVKCHEFSCRMDDDIPKARKIFSFIRFRRYAVKLLRKEKPDFLIMLHSLPCVLLCKELLSKYCERYIFDYRDFTYENVCFFRRIIHSLVKKSKAAFVSSDGFRKTLPAADNIYTSHNLPPDASAHRQEFCPRGQPPIRIGFWGFIRHEQLNRRIIDRLSGDERFELHYYGRMQAIADKLKTYAEKTGAKNVFFHGAYSPGEQDGFARETDLIHNIYSNTEAPSQIYAMTNKYYDGLIYRLPQLCMSGSYMGNAVEEQEVGLLCNPEDPLFADKIWQYYWQLNVAHFCDCCDKALERVSREYEEGKNVAKNAIGIK